MSGLFITLEGGDGTALAVARLHPDAWVIGSDQVAACEHHLLGKPGTREQADAALFHRQ